MHKKVVLVIGASVTQPLSQVIERVWRIADNERKAGHLVFAPCLDRRHASSSIDVEEIRGLEKQAIVRRFADEVRFADPNAPDLADTVALATQFGYAVGAIEPLAKSA